MYMYITDYNLSCFHNLTAAIKGMKPFMHTFLHCQHLAFYNCRYKWGKPHTQLALVFMTSHGSLNNQLELYRWGPQSHPTIQQHCFVFALSAFSLLAAGTSGENHTLNWLWFLWHHLVACIITWRYISGMEIFAEPLPYFFPRRPPKDELGGLIVNFKLHCVFKWRNMGT